MYISIHIQITTCTYTHTNVYFYTHISHAHTTWAQDGGLSREDHVANAARLEQAAPTPTRHPCWAAPLLIHTRAPAAAPPPWHLLAGVSPVATWFVHVCDATHLCVRHDSHKPHGTYLLMHNMLRHDSFICVTWLIHVCDMSHLCVWQDWHTPNRPYLLMCHLLRYDPMISVTRKSFQIVILFIYDTTHVCVTDSRTPHSTYLLTCHFRRHESFLCVAQVIYVCDVTHTHT